MRFARRQTEDVASPAAAAEGPQPPRGAPVAAFAGVLDGERLWVAVDARPGTIGLRRAGASTVVALPDEIVDDQPAYLAARLHLGGLPDDEAAYDVVVVPPGGRAAPAPVWSPPLPARPAPPTADGRTHHALRRTDDGFLQVHRTRLPDAATLGSVSAAGDDLDLTLLVGSTPSGTSTRTLALLGDDDTVVATFATTGSSTPGTVGVHLTSGPLGDAPAQVTRVVVGEPGAWLPVRRRANDLPDPGRAVSLPQLYDPDAEGDEPRLRLRWSGRGLLQARLFTVGAAAPTLGEEEVAS